MSTYQPDPISILKFGSSVLRSESDLAAAVHGIYAELRRGRRLLVVASAIGSTTDDLLSSAQAQSARPNPRDLARLLATGESSSAALLSLALQRAGIPSRLIGPEEIGLVAEGGHLDAHPIGLDVEAVSREFDSAPVLVLPGFIARRSDGDLVLFGRGGSDLTAIFIAGKLQRSASSTECVLVKDVTGLFEWDPAEQTENAPRRYREISYGDALQLSGDVVQHKAIRLAREFGLKFEVGCANQLGADHQPGTLTAFEPTSVGPGISVLDGNSPLPTKRLRVGLAGHGNVGAGVLQHLFRAHDKFEVAGVLVRNLEKHKLLAADSTGLKPEQIAELFTDDRQEFFERPFDVFVELVGGAAPTAEWIEEALESGRDVICANKALIATHGLILQDHARVAQRSLRFSAAVGGSTPMLEAARRLSSHSIRGFEGVLNGTSNFILDALSGGTDLRDAIRQAQELGYAEADPTLDIDGTDACQKAELIARELYGDSVTLRWGERIRLDSIPPKLFEQAREAEGVVRLVASCYLEGSEAESGGAAARVASLQLGPVILPPSHALTHVSGAGAGLVFDLDGAGPGRVVLEGQGAGRWPTAEAVFADLLDVHRSVGCRVEPSSSKL
jgi:homoserine dehydrogenase